VRKEEGRCEERKRSNASKGERERESKSRMDEENLIKGTEEQLDGLKA